MQGLVGSVPLVLIMAVGVCAPLAGWLAMQRGRNAVVWFVYGALTGPIALLLLVAAPVGRCPSCDTPVGGWAGSCGRCGAPLGGILNGRSPAPAPTRDPALAATLAEGGQPARDAEPRTARRAKGAAGSSSRSTSRPSATTATPRTDPAPVAAPAASSVAAAPPPTVSSPGPSGPASAGEVLATAVYLSGNAGLEIGACYGIARVEDRVRVFGPVDTGQLTIRHERPIDDGEILAIDDRIILTLRAGRSSTSMIMRWVGGMPPTGLEAALAPGAREGRPTDGLWR